MDPQPGSPAAIAAVAQPGGAREPAVSAAILLVLALVLLFSALAGWILLANTRADESGRGARIATTALLTIVPAVSAMGLLVHVQRSHEVRVQDRAAVDLTRTLSVIEAVGLGGSPSTIRAMSGFHAATVSDGRIELSTLGADAPAVASLPSPPPSFTTSGLVATPDGLSHYVAQRLSRARFIVVLTPLPIAEIEAVQSRSVVVGIVLTLWLLLSAAVVITRSSAPRVGDPTVTG
jgi:hypothetical protein